MTERESRGAVLFHMTCPPNIRDWSKDEIKAHLEYPAVAFVPLALELLKENQKVIFYMHPVCREIDFVVDKLDWFGNMGLEVIEAADDDNFEQLLREHHVSCCVLFHGAWTFHIQVACRTRGVDVVLMEAGVYERDNTVFVDSIGVATFSSLSAFRPTGTLPPDATEILQKVRSVETDGPALSRPYILLLLERSDTRYWPFNPRYGDPSVVIEELSAQFPNDTIVVRAHPYDRERNVYKLPPNCTYSDAKTSGAGWAQHCKWAIGFSSKSIFLPLLHGRPTVVLSYGLTNFFDSGTNVFVFTDQISHLSEENINARFNQAVAEEFLCHMLTEHRLRIRGDLMVRRQENRRSAIYRRLLLGLPE